MEKIKNLSLRKTIVLYLVVSLLISFFLSAWIMEAAKRLQSEIWWRYADQELYFELAEGEGIHYLTDLPRPFADDMTPLDHQLSELCDFLETYTVLLLSMAGSCIAVFLFYRNKLRVPLRELGQASRRIGENDLNFRLIYENRDEMGQLCREFEHMRGQLAENNRRLWKTIEEEKLLRAAIAHDIRSPLTVLRGYQEMLVECLEEKSISMEQALQMLKDCSRQTDRMDGFVDTMQRLASLEKRELRAEPVTGKQLKQELETARKLLAPRWQKEMRLQIPETEQFFFGDLEIIREVTENLLSNALRYAKETVTVTAELTKDLLKICVRDDGEGFPEDTEALTKAFHQQNIKDSLKHTGLGMYISRLYCEKHGGKLLLENQEGAAVTAMFAKLDERREKETADL